MSPLWEHLKDFVESEHPRDEAGKFSDVGTGLLTLTPDKPKSGKWEGKIQKGIYSQVSESEFKDKLGMDNETLIKLSGGDVIAEHFPDARVEMTHTSDSAKVKIFDKAGGLEIQRTFHYEIDEEGYGSPTYIDNDKFFIAEGKTGQGIGTRTFKSQVDEAAQSGFQEIRTTAGKSASMNGYYTWPRLGYDADIEYSANSVEKFPILEDTFYEDAPRGGRSYKVSDFMRTPEGRSFWKENGKQMDMSFDLMSGSHSRKVLDAYVQAKFG